MNDDKSKKWTVQDTADLYNVARWGDDYFHISDQGTLRVSPNRDPAQSIDINE